MTQELSLAAKKAADISEQMNILSQELQSIDIEPLINNSGGIDPFIFAITIFSLACFVGYYVVWKVTPALHTPLMSITNAVSGIIIIGALIASGTDASGLSMILGFLATFLASINIFGGFIVTERMLEMFKKK